jgi:hypothetical protein
VAAACVYGVLHDLVTAHVCIEYFTVFHPPLSESDSPVVQALTWGVVATWWVGLLFGLLLSFAARLGRGAKMPVRRLMLPLLVALLVCGSLAGAAGFVASLIEGFNAYYFPDEVTGWRACIDHERWPEFFGALVAHNTSYASGAILGLCLVVWVWKERQVETLRRIHSQSREMKAE